MNGQLTEDQIDCLLGQLFVGRIGCSDQQKPYVVPVCYAYANGFIYCQSREGLKLRIMRKNAQVCFQVDSIENLSNWRSATIWGKFEELKTAKAIAIASKIMADKFLPIATGHQVMHPTEGNHPPEIVERQPRAIYFRIRVGERAGRFEKN